RPRELRLVVVVQPDKAGAGAAGDLHGLDLDLRRVDDRLRYLRDRLRPLEVHRVILVPQGLEGREQVITQVFDLVFHPDLSASGLSVASARRAAGSPARAASDSYGRCCAA